MPVWENEWSEKGYTQNDDGGDRHCSPRHRSSKSEFGPAGRSGKRQDRLERAKGQEEEDEDVPPAQFEAHPERTSIDAAITLARSVDRGLQSRFAREPTHNFN